MAEEGRNARSIVDENLEKNMAVTLDERAR
jgi:hypothetical protein